MAVAARSLDRGSPRVGQASAFTQFLRALSIGVVLVILALGIVLWPTAMLLVLLLAVAGTVGVAAPRMVAATLGLAVIGVGLATWLGFTIIIVALLAVGMLAWSAPLYGFALAITIFGAEGSIKEVLSYSATPVSLSPVVLGGIFVDVALVVAVVGLLIADRGSALRSLWARLGTVGRISAGLLGAWLIGSLVQIPMSVRMADAVLGFRLTQGYAIVVVAGVVLAATAGHRAKKIILVAVSPVVFYATLRVVLGPSSVEQVFTSHRPGVTRYGDAVRATGSFSGAVGLVSFLVPVAALAVGLVVSSRRHRLWVSAILVCALTGIVASYTRAALVAVAAAAVFTLILLFTVGLPSTRRLVAVTVVAVLFTSVAGATVVASNASPQVHRRVDAVVHPERDLSLRMRLATWSRMVDAVWKHPGGSGLGTVGRASGIGDAATVTADQSYLKILREQGLAIGSLFVLAVLTACLAIIRGLRRCPGEARPLGIAALAGFVSFLVLAAFGEYVEQPGKVLAWTLLGIAAWQAYVETEPIP
jgi:hypothetical protein